MREQLVEILGFAKARSSESSGAYVHHFDTMAQCAQSLLHILDADQQTEEVHSQGVTALQEIDQAKSEARAMLDAQIAKAMEGVAAEIEKAREEARAEALARIDSAQTVEEIHRAWYDPRKWVGK